MAVVMDRMHSHVRLLTRRTQVVLALYLCIIDVGWTASSFCIIVLF